MFISASISAQNFTHNTFVEENGFVSIEAEHYTNAMGPWEEVEGRTAFTFEMQGHGVWPDSIYTLNNDHVITKKFPSSIRVSYGNKKLRWAFPSPTAQKLISLKNSPDKAALFLYEKGTEMPGMIAPEMRIMSFMPETQTPDSLWLVFKEAIDYALHGNNKGSIIYIHEGEYVQNKDSVLVHQLRAWNYNVKTMRDKLSSSNTTDSVSLIIISETSRFENIHDKFKDVRLPVLVLKSGLLNVMGMNVAQNPWKAQPGQYGNAMLNRSGNRDDNLNYSIYFKNPGKYYLWLLGKSSGTDSADECKVFFNTQKIASSDSGFFEICFDKHFGWTSNMFYQTKANRKTPGVATINVPAPGWYKLHIGKGSNPEPARNINDPRRYPNWRIDKIYLSSKNKAPQDEGPVETTNNGVIEVPGNFKSSEVFLPRQKITINNNYAIIEAEDIDHSPYWVLKNEPAGFTGKGYLEWNGPDRTVSVEGIGGNDDYWFVRQGAREEWLILQIEAADSGIYFIDFRNIHKRKDGDNDAWINKLGYKPYLNGENAKPVKRITDGHKDGSGFTWLDWSPAQESLVKGMNYLYIAGRSIGFGIDRIVVYKANDSEAKEKAMSLK